MLSEERIRKIEDNICGALEDSDSSLASSEFAVLMRDYSILLVQHKQMKEALEEIKKHEMKQFRPGKGAWLIADQTLKSLQGSESN